MRRVFEQGGLDKDAVQTLFGNRARHVAAAGLNPPYRGAAWLKILLVPRYGTGHTPQGTVLAILDSERSAEWFEDWTYFSWSCQFEASPPVYPADWTVEREFDLTVYEEISKTSWFRHYNSDSGNTIWI